VTPIVEILRETFGMVGFASAAAWSAAAALLVAGLRPAWRWPCWLTGVSAAVVGLGLALATSQRIRGIEVDRSAEVAQAQAAGAEKARERLQSRAARVRFAEDAAADRMDLAGVSEAEQQGAYERAVEEELAKVPAYRARGRQSRSRSEPAGDAPAGDRAAEIVESGDPEPTAAIRRLPESELIVADRFDRANQAIAWSLVTVAVGLCGLEYVRRYNSTSDAVWPLPWAGTFLDGLAAKEHVARLAPDLVPGFLELSVRKGETFIALVPDDPFPDRQALPRVALGPIRLDLPKRVFSGAELASDPGLAELVFETAWFNRGCFVITGLEEAGPALLQFTMPLVRRGLTRAVAARTLNVVWALPGEPPPQAAEELVHLARRLNVRWVRVSTDDLRPAR